MYSLCILKETGSHTTLYPYSPSTAVSITNFGDLFLVTSTGWQLHTYKNKVSSLCKFRLPALPNPMNFKKAGATSAMKSVSGYDMEVHVISQRMSHSQAISKKTYRNRERSTSAYSAFSKMQELLW